MDTDLLEAADFECQAGVDEVGRGPLAGDVVAAAVILDPKASISGLRDSKKLSEKRRTALYEIIVNRARCWCVGRATVAEIDRLNILHATMLAMKRAVEALSVAPDWVWVDGNRLPNWRYRSRAVVQGDSRIDAISAASIVAKVTRDREMMQLDQRYPNYGFARHKGYPTRQHRAALMAHGITPAHRRSFAPVQTILESRHRQEKKPQFSQLNEHL